MRTKNTGTFDHSTKTWRIRGKGIQVSIRQLSKRYGVPIDPSERASLTWWKRYLQEREEEQRAAAEADRAARLLNPLLSRFGSMLDHLTAAGHPDAALEGFRAILTTAPPPTPPIGRTPLPARVIGSVEPFALPAPVATGEATVGGEATVFIDRHKGNRAGYQVRQAVELLTGITGDIPVKDVTVHHFREAHTAIVGHESWGGTTKAKIMRYVRSFLSNIEADHNVTFGFLKSKAYRIRTPDGQKVQYTIDQVKTALQHATGDVRTMLLLGLNAGQYVGDIATNTPAMIQAGYLIRSRAKLGHQDDAATGSWLLWPETRKHLKFDLTERNLQKQYTAFRLQHGLPEHKALRKTTTQLIEDHVGGEVARLFRGEKPPGTHGKSYVKSFTPPQVAKLDEALRTVAGMYGLEVG